MKNRQHGSLTITFPTEYSYLLLAMESTGTYWQGAICNGEVIPEKLASLRNRNCKRSEEEIAKALQTNGRKDYLLALRHEYRMYQDIQLRIKECDIEIEKTLTQQIMGNDDKQEHLSTKKFIKE